MDANCNARVSDMFCKLEWDVETAKQANLIDKIDDTAWIKHARKDHRIGITFDELQKEQGVRVSRELL